MSGTLFTNPRYTPVNNAGTPRAGAVLYFYQAGTSTLANVYTTSDLSTPHTSPVAADAAGVFPAIYLDPSAGYDYKAICKTSATGSQVWSEDNIPATSTFRYPRTSAEIAAGVTPTDYSVASHEAVGHVHAGRYGVVGDFTTDDTTAMGNAIAVCLVLESTEQPANGTVTLSRADRGPALFIPGGWRVRITSGLTCPLAIISDGFAKIECENATTVMFTGTDRYYFYAEGIIFVEGETHVALSNSNLNAGRWEFNRCEFFLSDGYAVTALNTSGSYAVTSTLLKFTDCKWRGCRKQLHTQCDHAYVNGGWWQPQADWVTADTAMVRNEGLLTLTNVLLVGLAQGSTTPARLRWIDNYGAVNAKHCRFPAENAGFPIIYHWANPDEFTAYSANYVQHGITFDGCELAVGADARGDSAAIYLQGELPVRVSVTNCSGLLAGKGMIVNDPADGGIANIATYLTDLATTYGDDLKHRLFYTYHGNHFQRAINERLWPVELDLYTYMDRPLTPRICKVTSATNQTCATGATTILTYTTAEYDPYDLADFGATDGIRAPEYAKFARISGYVEVSSHTANNLIYNARLYNNSTNIPDAYVNYLHEITGTIRIQIQGEIAVTYNDLINMRFAQSSGGDLTVSRAALTVEFL